MNNYRLNESFFAESRAVRNTRCAAKDAIVAEILAAIRITKPAAFRAVLMPSLYGPEVNRLRDRGVPVQNLFAIERDWRVHALLSRRAKRRQGPTTTPRPLQVAPAMDYVPFHRVNLVYLDFFGPPAGSHLRALIKLFRLKLLAPNATLIVTFGENRGEQFSADLNRRLKTSHWGQAYIEAAIAYAGHRNYRKLINHPYKTSVHVANFTTTEVRF